MRRRAGPAHLLASLLELPLVVREPLRPLDAIVVLGAPLGPGDTLTPVLDERVAAAAALWRAGGGRIVVASGGVTGRGGPPREHRGTHGRCGTHGRRAESEVMAEALRARGVADVLVEDGSRTTAENARLTAALLAPLGARSAWIVTQPFHGRRAVRLFRAAGLDAHAWHIEDSLQYADRGRAVRWLVREYAAWLKL
ncbi:MAG TPA: YdcF family protein, partial [Kofleriaceae bacterium]|nr:YdcF family protein [Kofleriaceae bacterium]